MVDLGAAWAEHCELFCTASIFFGIAHLPDACGLLVQALWSPLASRDWPSFLHRLKAQLPHLDARNMNYRQLE